MMNFRPGIEFAAGSCAGGNSLRYAWPMTLVDFSRLRDAVRHRLEVVADRELYARDPQAHLARLVAASEDLDRLTGELPRDADPMLRHYLERQSYVKALDWLEARTR